MTYFGQLGYMPLLPGILCGLDSTVLFMASMCSTFFIVFMTFQRFYSIIKPHKAASFNTVKRAKVTILCVITFSVLYNIPHTPYTMRLDTSCVTYHKGMSHIWAKIYYCLSLVINYFLPFILLLVMNSFIISTLRKRSDLIVSRSRSDVQEAQNKHQDHNKSQSLSSRSRSRSDFIVSSKPDVKVTKNAGQGHNNKGQGLNQKVKKSERHIFVTLLFVTFAFLILSTPAYSYLLYVVLYDYETSPQSFANFILFESIQRNVYISNYAINFFLYVISGRKFRSDLRRLFRCHIETTEASSSQTKVFTLQMSNDSKDDSQLK